MRLHILIGLGALLTASLTGCVQDAADIEQSAAQFEPPMPTETVDPGEDDDITDPGDGVVDPGVTSDINVCDDIGNNAVLIVQQLDFLRQETNLVSDGFDLDGAGGGEATGCNQADYTSPDGTAHILNDWQQFGELVIDTGG
ncbi:MAG: hypothetical protein AAFX99_23120, partial [Myxococcota bacterium]